MGKSGNTLILLFGPAVTVVGIDSLVTDGLRGLWIILLASLLTVIGSYYQWIGPKNRSKLWLILPGLFTGFGYFPLMLLKEKKRIFDYLNSGYDLFKSADAPDIFAYIAVKITKYYLELSRNYFNRFDNEVALIATAGYLETQEYIERGEISLGQIMRIAKESYQTKGEALVNFIINLEIKMFSSGDEHLKISEVREACFEKREDINSAVQKVKSKYLKEEEFVSTTSKLFKSHQFGSSRQALGIIDPVLIKTDLGTIFSQRNTL